MLPQKCALIINDISCVGKCSLTVALPVLSAAGVETSVLPTAVLSTHTGGFGRPVFCDLTENLAPMAAHWREQGVEFDALYTGYLGSSRQVELMLDLSDQFPGAMKLVDPVMGDNGRLYSGFTLDFPAELAKLCANADILVPNVTEAALLLNEPYAPPPYTRDYVEGLLHRLSDLCPGKLVLTGVSLEETDLGCALLDPAEKQVDYVLNPRVPGHFHGTGDLFAAALLAGLLADRSLTEATALAAGFTARSITLTDPAREERYGVRFEAALPFLMEELNLV